MQYDVIIVGGAMAGATLALALSSKTNGKIKIAVLEKNHQKNTFKAGLMLAVLLFQMVVAVTSMKLFCLKNVTYGNYYPP